LVVVVVVVVVVVIEMVLLFESANLTNRYFLGEYEVMEKLKGHHRNIVNVEECIKDEAN